MMLQKTKILLRIKDVFLAFHYKDSGFGSNWEKDIDFLDRVFLPPTSNIKIILTSNPNRWHDLLPYFETRYYLRKEPKAKEFSLLDSFFIVDIRHKKQIYYTLKHKKKIELYIEDGGEIFMRKPGIDLTMALKAGKETKRKVGEKRKTPTKQKKEGKQGTKTTTTKKQEKLKLFGGRTDGTNNFCGSILGGWNADK